MRISGLLLLVALSAAAGFAILNWGVFITPTELSLGFTSAQIPLGLVMFGLLVFVTALFLVYIVYLQSSALLETRRHSRELKTNRELADQAEASRFTELRKFLEAQLAAQSTLHAETRSGLIARIEAIETNLRGSVEQSGNTLAAYIGELEDRLEKRGIA